MTNFIKPIKKQLFRFRKPKGCSVQEINELEMSVGFLLPEAYKQYLLYMGKDYQGPLRGTDCFLKHALQNTAYLPDLLDENQNPFELPDNYLAFYSHQGYAMAWFILPKENDNPPVYYWNEGQDLKIPTQFSTFTDFFVNELREISNH